MEKCKKTLGLEDPGVVMETTDKTVKKKGVLNKVDMMTHLSMMSLDPSGDQEVNTNPGNMESNCLIFNNLYV